jgi:hypothetical protein
MRYIHAVEHEPDMMRFLYARTGLDLRGQPLDGPNWFCVAARDSVTGEVVAALACEFKTWFDVSFSAAVDQPGAITRSLLKGIFQALFSRARRVTALVEPTDLRTEDLVKRLGFVYEGFSRLGFDGDRDALVYGMLKQDCKYIPSVRAARSLNGDDPHGQPAQTARSLRDSLGPAGRQRRIGGGERYH